MSLRSFSQPKIKELDKNAAAKFGLSMNSERNYLTSQGGTLWL